MNITNYGSPAKSPVRRVREQVVNDRHAGAGPAGEQPGEAAVAAGDGQLVEHPRGSERGKAGVAVRLGGGLARRLHRTSGGGALPGKGLLASVTQW